MVSQVLEPTSLFQTWCLASTQVYKVYERETSPRELGHLVLPCMDYGMGCVEWYPKCWSPQPCSRLGVLQAHKCTRYMRERQVQERLVTLSYLVWIGMGCVEWYPKCWSPQACSRLGVLQAPKCTSYMRERQVHESLVTLSYLAWIGMGCVEWYPKCWSPQACSRLGVLQAHKCTRYMRDKSKRAWSPCLTLHGLEWDEWYPKC